MTGTDTEKYLPESTLRSPERLEAFFDAVLAIAITIMTLSFQLPDEVIGNDVGTMFWVIWPQLLLYVIAFAILASFWMIHHRIFAVIRFANNQLVFINMAIIFFICLVPFSTSLNMDPDVGSGKMVFFQSIMLIIAVLFLLQWIWVRKHPQYLKGTLSPSYIKIHTTGALLFLIIAFIALILSFIIPYDSSFAYFGILAWHFVQGKRPGKDVSDTV